MTKQSSLTRDANIHNKFNVKVSGFREGVSKSSISGKPPAPKGVSSKKKKSQLFPSTFKVPVSAPADSDRKLSVDLTTKFTSKKITANLSASRPATGKPRKLNNDL